jgi:neutral ceramidase
MNYVNRRFWLVQLLVVSCAVAVCAADEPDLCQTGRVLVVPQGEPGVRVGEFVTASGGRPSAPTCATAKWDDKALTVVFDCVDTNIVAQHTRRDDPDMWRDDGVELFLDVGHAHNPATTPWVHIIASASGGLSDFEGGDPWYAQQGGNSRFAIQGLTSIVARTAEGWRVTVLVPWQGLGKKPGIGDVWGINFNRSSHPEEEYSGWAPTREGFCSFQEWGHIAFAPAGRTQEDVYGTNNALLSMARTHADVFSLMWKAGTAQRNITPMNPLWMAGYGIRNHPAEKKETDLWAKMLVLEDRGGSRAVLITLDLLGMERSLVQSICARLEKQFGLRRDQISFAFSHTHSGPVVGLCLGATHYALLPATQQALIDAYAQQLEEQVVNGVGEALGALAPALLSWGNGQATFAVNRRMNREGRVSQLRAAGQLRGPVDPDVPVLAIRNPTGALRAVVFGYACHATVLADYTWNADYPGYAQSELETLHPGVQAMFWAGCGADQNPLPRHSIELAKRHGHQLAMAVDAVLAGLMRPIPAQLQTRYREIALPFETPLTLEQIREDAESKDQLLAARARLFMRAMDAVRPLCPTYPYPVTEWRLGDDIQWVFLGGEVVVDYALRLKAEQRGIRTWVTGYANDIMGYIPSRRVLQEGGYEATGAVVAYGLQSAWTPALEDMIIDAVSDQKGK